MNQELVPNDALPDDFIRAIKHSDYSSVSEFIFFFFFFLIPSISTVYLI